MSSRFNLYPLWVFVTVAQQSSVTRASSILGISQPAASAHLKQLEKRYSRKLFEKNRPGMRLSPWGRGLFQQALRVFEELENLEVSVGAENFSGLVEVSASRTPGTYWLPRLVVEFQSRHPDIRCKINLEDSRSAAAKVSSGEAPFAVLGNAPLPLGRDSLFRHQVAQDTLALTGLRGDFKNGFDRATLAGQRLILREPGSSTREHAEEMLADMTSLFSSTLELGSPEAVKEAVLMGLGVTVLSSWAVEREVRDKILIQSRSPRFRRTRVFHAVRERDRPLLGPARLLWEFVVRDSAEAPAAPTR